MLLPRTRYAAYFVFRWSDNAHGFDDMELSIGLSDGEQQVQLIKFNHDMPFPEWAAGGRFYEDLRRSLDGCDEIEIPRARERGSKERMESGMDLSALPEGCIATILSLTSPEDACRLSLLCKTFLSAATSDAVWGAFLPADIVSSHLAAGVGSKRELYFRLCDFPLLIDGNKMNFSLERRSGKKCYMLSARKLSIVWGDTPPYWAWEAPAGYWFEVAELLFVWWFEIHGQISTSMLSPKTKYAAYFVFKWLENGAYGFHDLELSIGALGGEKEVQNINFDPTRYYLEWPARGRFSEGLRERADGWKEIEIGEFFSSGDEDEELEMSLREVNCGYEKSVLMVYGIELRPKER